MGMRQVSKKDVKCQKREEEEENEGMKEYSNPNQDVPGRGEEERNTEDRGAIQAFIQPEEARMRPLRNHLFLRNTNTA